MRTLIGNAIVEDWDMREEVWIFKLASERVT
jgi:hypothetical protein